jgi:hypothetical protein
MCKLYIAEDKTELCGTLASVYLAVDISLSTKTMNCCCERNELISLIKLIENSNLDNLYSKPICHVVSKALSIPRIPQP